MWRILFCLCPYLLGAQLVLFDDFSDGDFLYNPPWTGDTALFIVDQQALRLQDTAAGEAYLSVASSISVAAQWDFHLRMSFNPSSSNYARLYLLSDHPSLKGSLQAYFLKVGGNSQDELQFYRQDGLQETLLWQSQPDLLDRSSLTLHLRCTRDSIGRWRFWADTAQSGLSYLGSVSDDRYYYSSHLGWRCHYTRTRADRFYLDSLHVQGRTFLDTLAPLLDSIAVLNAYQVQLYFNEALEESTAEQSAAYLLADTLHPTLAVLDLDTPLMVRLDFTTALPANQHLSLGWQGIEDRFGNRSTGQQSLFYRRVHWGEIRISEIMADPEPSVHPQGLPAVEFLELYNASAWLTNLGGMELQLASRQYVLPSYELAPGAYLLVCREESTDEFADSLEVLGLDWPSSALSNEGALLRLLCREGQAVDSVHYQKAWHADGKQEGGWSLELVDLAWRCEQERNWRSSEAEVGGSPGALNSVVGQIVDTLSPRLTRVGVLEADQISLFLNEALPEYPSDVQLHFEPPLEVLERSWQGSPPALNLQLSQDLEVGQAYRISLALTAQDCGGNLWQADTLLFGVPQNAEEGKVLISELLYDPSAEGAEFIELHNAGDKIVDLQHLRLAIWDTITEQASDFRILSAASRLLFPGEYLALSNAPEKLLHYPQTPPEQTYACADLPGLSNAGAALALCDARLELIDRIQYRPQAHHPLLDDPKGISLERLDFAAPALRDDQWQSAAQPGATPGRANSQRGQTGLAGQWAAVPRVFSPNLDGYHDFTQLQYQLPTEASRLEVYILNPEGQLIKTLSEASLGGAAGSFQWDGRNESGQMASRGIYVAALKYFSLSGAQGVLRTTVILNP